MARKVKEITINKEWCKGCGICVQFCPKKILKINDSNKVEVISVDNCSGCRLCELRCPDFAIEIRFMENEQSK